MDISPGIPYRHKRGRRLILLALSAVLVGGIACSIPAPPEDTATPVEEAPSATEPPPAPTATQTPSPEPTEPPTETPTSPPSPTPTVSPWEGIKGMWSGCPADAGVDVLAEPCVVGGGGYPEGLFLTLFLLPDCEIGETCGSYVKGRFDSQFILFHLTLQEISGKKVIMYADAGGGMYEGFNRDVKIKKSGANVRIVESTGESYFLPSGCDPVISTYFKCWDTVP